MHTKYIGWGGVGGACKKEENRQIQTAVPETTQRHGASEARTEPDTVGWRQTQQG